MRYLNQRGKGRPNVSRPGQNRKDRIMRGCQCWNSNDCPGADDMCVNNCFCYERGVGPRPRNFTGTQWQQDTPVGTQWQRSGVFNNFNGDEPAPKKGSVAQYIMGLLGVGILFYTIGFALKKGQLEGK